MTSAGDIIYRTWTLLVFIASLFFVFFPQKIRVPRLCGKVGPFTVPINFAVAPCIGVLLLLVTLALPARNLGRGLVGNHLVHPWQIVILFYAVAYLCLSLDLTGIFKWLTLKTKRRAGRSGTLLFVAFYLLASFITALTSNDIVILSLSPVIIYFMSYSKTEPDAYLFGEFYAANTLSMALQIGNPTNIIISQAFNVPFSRYFIWFVLPAVVSGAVALGVLYFYFKKQIPADLPPGVAGQEEAEERAAVPSWTRAIFGSGWLMLCLLSLVSTSWLERRFGWAQLWIFEAIFAGLLLCCDIAYDVYLWRKRRRGERLAAEAAADAEFQDQEQADDAHASRLKHQSYTLTALSHMPWAILSFVLSMFVMVEALSYRGWLDWIAAVLGRMCDALGPYGSVWLMTYLSALACCVLNNQPMAILFTRVLTSPKFHVYRTTRYAAMLGTIMGSNFGALLAPIGALAGVMWLAVLKAHKVDSITNVRFVKTGFILAPAIMASACAVMCLQLGVFPRSLLF